MNSRSPKSIPRSRRRLIRHRRAGWLALEAVMSSLLAASALALGIHAAVLTGAERMESHRRHHARLEASNALEIMASLPWERITDATAATVHLSDGLKPSLPGGQLSIEIEDEPGTPPARRITAAVSWRGRSGQETGPVRLTTWVYAREGRNAIDP
jgi:hypothetical protein